MPVEFELALTPEAFSRWIVGRDGDLGGVPVAGTRVPLTYLVFLRAQPMLGTTFHRLLDRDPDRALYGGGSYRLMTPLTVGQTLRGASEVQSRKAVASPRGLLTVTTLLTTYRTNGEVCATETVRMIDLPAGPPAAPAPAAPAAPVPAEAPRQPKHPPLVVVPPITCNQVAWLTVETGDLNALHLDVAYAARRGYRDVLVPATLISALIERELQAAHGALVELDVRYHGPTFPDDSIALSARLDGDRIDFEAFVDGALRAEGRARREGAA